MLSGTINDRYAPPRMPDKLEDVYTEEAQHFMNEEKARKRIYSQIIQKSNERINQKRAL